MQRKSIRACIEEATRYIREAADAPSEEAAFDRLTKAGAWLEIAKKRAEQDPPLVKQ